MTGQLFAHRKLAGGGHSFVPHIAVDAPAGDAQTLCEHAQQLASLFKGAREIPGAEHNPFIVAMLQWFGPWAKADETAWCGAAAATVLRLNGLETPGPESWRAWQARRFLTIGDNENVSLADGNCLAIFRRGGPATGIDGPGHVGFVAESEFRKGEVVRLKIFGGNQNNSWNARWYSTKNLLGIRRMR